MVSLLYKETCGQVGEEKPKDAFRFLFDFVNCLGVFATGEVRVTKHRQMRYLLNKWNVDMVSFIEAQIEWTHADKWHQVDNLFARRRNRHSVAACNSTVRKILSSRNQRDGTTMMTFGRAVANV